VQYADDTLLIVTTDARNLFNIKGLLRAYSDSTGLHVNFQMSFLVPIMWTIKKTTHLANTFGCQLGTMHFSYLGLPMGITRAPIDAFSPLIAKFESRIIVISKFLSY
jgi:hypothetical protein